MIQHPFWLRDCAILDFIGGIAHSARHFEKGTIRLASRFCCNAVARLSGMQPRMNSLLKSGTRAMRSMRASWPVVTAICCRLLSWRKERDGTDLARSYAC